MTKFLYFYFIFSLFACIIKCEMKAVYRNSFIALAAIALLLAAIFGALFFPAPAAAEDLAAGDYMVKSGSTLVLRNISDAGNPPLIEVPATYYVHLSGTTVNSGYYTVSYAGENYYVSPDDLTSNTTLHDEAKYGAVPEEKKYYTFDKTQVFPAGEYQSLSYTSAGLSSSMTIDYSKINTVYGLVTIDGTLYYSCNITIEILGTTTTGNAYIAASSAAGTYASLTPAAIPANPYEQDKAAIDEELSKPTPPSTEEEGSASTADPETPDNNLERIILSVIIAILCVAVVLLIFRPGRKNKTSKS